MPVVLTPARRHDCVVDNRVDSSINRVDLPAGTVFECPDCGRLWLAMRSGTLGYLSWAEISRQKFARLVRVNEKLLKEGKK